MGMFDSVYIPCPKCGEESEFQSKGGDCFLHNYSLEDCPQDVLSDVNRHSPVKCEKCGTFYEVSLTPYTVTVTIPRVVEVSKPIEKDTNV